MICNYAKASCCLCIGMFSISIPKSISNNYIEQLTADRKLAEFIHVYTYIPYLLILKHLN